MNALKRTLIVMVGLIILLYIAIVICMKVFFNENDLKRIITRTAYTQTGRVVTIKGHLGLTFFPWPGVTISDVTVGNPKGWRDSKAPYLAHIGKASIQVQLWPVLRGHFQPKSFTLSQANIYLDRTAHGANWQFTHPHQAVKKQSATTAKAASQAPSFILELKQWLFGVSVTDTHLQYTDAMAHQQYTLSHLNLTIKPSDSLADIKLAMSAQLQRKNPMLNVHINAKSAIEANWDDKQFTLNDTEINGSILPTGLPALPFTFTTSMQANLNKQELNMPSLHVDLGDNVIQGSLKCSLKPTLSLNGDLNTNTINPRKLARYFKLTLPGKANVLQNLRLQLHVQGKANHYSLNKLIVHLDQTQLNGQAHINLSALPDLTWQLHGNKINLGDYLSSGKQTTTTRNKKQPSANANKSLDFTFLKKVHWSGKMTLDQLQYQKFTFTHVRFDTKDDHAKVSFAPLSAQLGQGKIEANGYINASNPIPSMSSQFSASNVSLQPLMQGLFNKSNFSGLLNIKAQLATRGRTHKVMTRNLSGAGNLTVTQAQIHNFDLQHTINTAMAAIKKQPPPKKSSSNTTLVKTIRASYRINAGVATSQLDLDSGHVSITGNGTMNLNNQTINYTLNTRYDDGSKKWMIPLLLRGPIASAKVQINMAALLKQYAGQEVKKLLDNSLKNFFKKKMQGR